MSNVILSAHGLVRRRGAETIVDGVNLKMARREAVALVGTSGCGKTTLLHMLGGLDRPSAGQVYIDRQDFWKRTPVERADLRLSRIGFVFQLSNLLPQLSARENVALPAWRKHAKHAQALAHADELLARFGLTGRADAAASTLSLGEAQRVTVARALVNDPGLILADEPTGSLDSETGRTVIAALLSAKSSGAAVLVVTHDIEVAHRFDRVLHMQDGRITMASP